MIRGIAGVNTPMRRPLSSGLSLSLLALLALTACRRRDVAATPDAARVTAPTAPAAPPGQTPAATPGFHVCFGASGSAVELPFAQPCTSVGANDTPPTTVPQR